MNTHQALIDRLIGLYNGKPPFNRTAFARVYADDVVFTDPVHTLHGIEALCACLDKQYASVTTCTFIPVMHASDGDHLFLQWNMHMQHPKLNKGGTVTVNGLSHLECRQEIEGCTRIVRHRDYFDLGQMIYENVPIIGALNRRVKKGLSV
jgi:limonene-1,2-epoxide hydrolase